MICFFKRSLCLYMAFQVLLAGTGVAMYEHWCFLKGTKTASLLHKEKCQKLTAKFIYKEVKKDDVIKRTKCCADKVSYYKIQIPSADGSSAHFTALPIEHELIFLPSCFSLPSRLARSVSFSLAHVYSAAPPLYGRSMLIFVQSFLI